MLERTVRVYITSSRPSYIAPQKIQDIRACDNIVACIETTMVSVRGKDDKLAVRMHDFHDLECRVCVF